MKNIYKIILLLFAFKSFASIEQQAENIKKYVKNESLGEVFLVLGVNVTEEEPNKRFSENYIFLNIAQEDENSNRALTVDFNDLNHLQELSSALPEFFDQIILDDSTFKFTHWSKEHLVQFKKILKPGGKFIFGPHLALTTLDFSIGNPTTSEYKKSLIKNLPISKDEFIISFNMPYKFSIHEEDLRKYWDKIDKQFKIYKEFQTTPEENWNQVMGKYNIHWQPSDYVLQGSDEKIKKFVTKDIVNNSFKKKFFFQVLLKENILRITKEVFGENNVILEENKPLPFKSNYYDRQTYLITAVKSID